MSDLNTDRMASDYPYFRRSYNAAISTMPKDVQQRLREVFKNYLAAYGLDGVFERMKGRTAAEIIAEYAPADVNPIVSGEIDGVRYSLYDRPSQHDRDG
jgi:hypothetical protein